MPLKSTENGALCGISCRITNFPFITVNILDDIVVIMYTENTTAAQDKGGVLSHTWAKGQRSLLRSDNNILEIALKTNSSLECDLVTRKPVTDTGNKCVSDGVYQLTCITAEINSGPDGKCCAKVF
jgi:hypothetical protein